MTTINGYELIDPTPEVKEWIDANDIPTWQVAPEIGYDSRLIVFLRSSDLVAYKLKFG